MNRVYRCYAEKRPGFDVEAQQLYSELKEQLGMEGLTGVRILYRYDVERISEAVYRQAEGTVFSEPMVDSFYEEEPPAMDGPHTILAVEALPGQFDQRADSCAQCIQLLAGCDRPLVKAATLYVLQGDISPEERQKAAGYLINPVERREAAM
ncbi:MAG: phosphoribosylformylglycinamidine synthase, partial [Clostridiales bacterium]|nr:phosphoribosylformylglycinamidine synthase [Clostridiales bacterium]